MSLIDLIRVQILYVRHWVAVRCFVVGCSAERNLHNIGRFIQKLCFRAGNLIIPPAPPVQESWSPDEVPTPILSCPEWEGPPMPSHEDAYGSDHSGMADEIEESPLPPSATLYISDEAARAAYDRLNKKE